MKQIRRLTLIFTALIICGSACAQDFDEIDNLWHRVLDFVHQGDKDHARVAFGEFNQRVRTYVATKGLSWQTEYLVGSLDCQFSDTRTSGSQLLKDVLQNNRDLNSAGQSELQSQLSACQAQAAPIVNVPPPDLPQDLVATIHFQTPGVHGDMKGGFFYRTVDESATAVSPIKASELLARRVAVGQPQVALDAALARLPAGTSGALIQGFAVVSPGSDKSRAVGIGDCLKGYTPPLKNQFKIEPASYVVTVYTAAQTSEVYQFARDLHGIQLPQGVVAYSVPEDMSLVAIADPQACGSAAHELVHLLIKQNFPVSPAWLEEGLASEVAVASPTTDHFKFSYSWRDDMLKQNLGLRPSVADLLELPWSRFSASNFVNLREVAATQAMAAVFIRYLDSKGKLADVYFGCRDNHRSSDLSNYMSYSNVLEEKLGMSVSDVDKEFMQWFSRQTPSGEGAGAPCVIVAGPEQQARPCEPKNAAAPKKY